MPEINSLNVGEIILPPQSLEILVHGHPQYFETI